MARGTSAASEPSQVVKQPAAEPVSGLPPVLEAFEDYPGGTAVRTRCPLCGALYIARLARVESGESARCPSCVLDGNTAAWLHPLTDRRSGQVPPQTSAADEPSQVVNQPAAEVVATILGDAGRHAGGRRLVLAQCQCGARWTARDWDVRTGHTRRCPNCAQSRRRLGVAA